MDGRTTYTHGYIRAELCGLFCTKGQIDFCKNDNFECFAVSNNDMTSDSFESIYNTNGANDFYATFANKARSLELYGKPLHSTFERGNLAKHMSTCAWNNTNLDMHRCGWWCDVGYNVYNDGNGNLYPVCVSCDVCTGSNYNPSCTTEDSTPQQRGYLSSNDIVKSDFNTNVGTCLPCASKHADCDPDHYLDGCGTNSLPGTCTSCTTPGAGQYVSTACSALADTVIEDCTTCDGATSYTVSGCVQGRWIRRLYRCVRRWRRRRCGRNRWR